MKISRTSQLKKESERGEGEGEMRRPQGKGNYIYIYITIGKVIRKPRILEQEFIRCHVKAQVLSNESSASLAVELEISLTGRSAVVF